MWTITDPKSTRTQCEAAVPSRPIGLIFSSRRLRDDPAGDGLQLPLRAARADHEVVGHRRQAGEIQQDDVGGLLVLGQFDDPPGEVERRALPGGRGGRAVGQTVGARRGRGVGWESGAERVRSRSRGPPCVLGRAHGRRCRPRPHPGRGSAAIGRPRRGPATRSPRVAAEGRRGTSPDRRGRAGWSAR